MTTNDRARRGEIGSKTMGSNGAGQRRRRCVGVFGARECCVSELSDYQAKYSSSTKMAGIA